MMIEDEELRITFKVASEEHLQKLDEGLLILEKTPDNPNLIAEMMREAHSLKGDANMLGVKDIGTLSHQLEHLLMSIKKGETVLTPALCDRMFAGIAAIRGLLQEAVTGIPPGVNTFYALAQLMGANVTPTPAPEVSLEETKEPPKQITEELFETPLKNSPINPPTNFVPTEEQTPPLKLPKPVPETKIKKTKKPPSELADNVKNTAPITPEPEIKKGSRYIQDEELRTTFKIACEEHLQKLDEGLLYLEKNPNNAKKIEEMLREAHSIKGDAGMLGIPDISTLAHQLENILNSVTKREISITPKICDQMSELLGNIRELVSEAVSGVPSNINIQPITQPNVATLPTLNEDIITIIPRSQPTEKNAPHHPNTDNYRIESIRVETRNLDALMTLGGELTVTKIRVAHRLSEIENIVSLWEKWSRDIFINRFTLDEIQRTNKVNSINQIKNLHESYEEHLEELGNLVESLKSSLYEDSARLDVISSELEEGIRTLRLLPLLTIFNLFPRLVRDLGRQQEKQVELIIEGGETRADKRILEEMKDPLTHIIRNAIDHGIELPDERIAAGKPPTATIRLSGYQTANHIILEISDDGRGLDIEAIKRTALKRGVCREEELASLSDYQIQSLIFSPGFSTRTFVTEVSGRGVGLDVVRTNVERLKGTIQVESTPGKGCTLRLKLCTTLATAHVLLVAVNNVPYAIPVEFVEMARLLPIEHIFTIEGRDTIILDNQPVSIARLSDLLELPISNDSPLLSNNQNLSCIILKVGQERLGLIVDALLDEQDVVLKSQSKLLQRVRNVSGTTILGTGEVCVVLNPQDLMKSVQRQFRNIIAAPPTETTKRKQVILLVEDSIATRTQEKRILESAGYEVITAVDGLDGYNKLKERNFDGVVSDIQMPNLDGLGLTEKIRQHKEYSELPVILVTSLASDEDKRRGASAGASAYITKNAFNQEVLIETLKRLI
ncbi:MAG TPA: hybrid sensor histidine kinase/response regulator [Halomicronema sp.]